MKVSLYTSGLASMAHDAIVLPWLKRAAGLAPAAPNAVAVLVPQRSDAYYLKALALDSGAGLWGVHFLTPSDLRDRLVAHLGLPTRIPLREHLRLLLATAAEQIAAGHTERAMNAIAVAPDQLLKALDMIGAAGWEFDQAGPRRLRPAVEEFHRLLDRAGWQMMHQADRRTLAATDKPAPCFAELLIVGFNALHWPQWPLLEAAVRLAGNTVVCLTDPRLGSEDLDGAWIGTWENAFAAAESIAADHLPPLAEALTVPETLAARAERETDPIHEIEFLVGADTASHARAIVAKALQYLADPQCARLGVLFSGASALSRRVAALLAEGHVPHYDGLAHQSPGPLEDAAWPAWLSLQESPRAPALLQFLDVRPGEAFGQLTNEVAAAELRHAIQELLIDDLAVIAEFLAPAARESTRALAEALRACPLLPETASLGDYFTQSAEIFGLYGWTERRQALEGYLDDWRPILGLPIARRTWLRWLRETLDSWQTRRAEAGSHPYSRLHLLPYQHAESQAWTHLIATGLNEGQWPPAIEESGFLDDEEIATLNAQVRTLNQRASVQGRQGEGHLAVQPGKALCLGPAQRRQLAERQFFNTLESASVAVAATMQVSDEAAPERPLHPSEFFTALHFAARGRPVSQLALDALQAETARWLQAANLWPSPPPDRASAQSTRAAFDARRDPSQPFGDCDFGLRGLPPRALRLPATDWENALASPAPIFLKVVLGVSAGVRDDETPWARTQGIWVHRWLSAIAPPSNPPSFSPVPATEELIRRVRVAADGFRAQVSAALAARQRAVPDWWQSTWQQARGAATTLADSVAAVEGRTHAATEWRMENTAVQLSDGTLYVRGRIDLLLSADGSLDDVWLVDYKTGHRQGLRINDLAVGKGLQLGLYALALRANGAREVGASLLAPGLALEQPQIQFDDLGELGELCGILLRMQETGVFGMLGPLRAEFGYGQDYPLATLAIDEEILEEKWTLTHPPATPEEEP